MLKIQFHRRNLLFRARVRGVDAISVPLVASIMWYYESRLTGMCGTEKPPNVWNHGFSKSKVMAIKKEDIDQSNSNSVYIRSYLTIWILRAVSF